MERVYNKLVRDKIPNIIENNGEVSVTRILDNDEYKLALEKKLYEEYLEVIDASGMDRVEELADMIEVIRTLSKLEGKSLDDVIDIADKKNIKRGSFDDRIFLVKVIEKN